MRREIDSVSAALVAPDCVLLVGCHWSSVCAVLMLRDDTGPVCVLR